MEKICSTCKNLKTTEEFNKDKYKPDGLTSSCKVCISNRWKKYSEDNADKLKQRTEEFNAKRRQQRREDPETVREEAREYYKNNKEKRKALDKTYRERHSEAIKVRRKMQREKNKLKIQLRLKLWRSKNIDKIREKVRSNAGHYAATSAKRRAAKLKATPIWLNTEQLLEIKLLYLFVASRRKTTGLDLEVDHIVPLQGENVCGLHVPWNLQVLTASENAAKGNRFTQV
jgi:5-methylcytosine-specific restriction endonuclease McrA